MRKADAGIAVAAVLVLLWWLKQQQRQATTPTGSTGVPDGWPGIPFLLNFASPPPAPIVIGGGMNVPPVEKSWLNNLVEGVVDMGAKFVARGLRNNNPLNIANNPKNPWKGLTASATEKTYAVFEHPMWGIRAAGKVLDSYKAKGFTTVRQIIERWAPVGDGNDVENYLAHVRQATGWHDGYVPSRANYPALVAVMVKHENGSNPFSVAELTQWLNLA